MLVTVNIVYTYVCTYLYYINDVDTKYRKLDLLMLKLKDLFHYNIIMHVNIKYG